MSECVKNDCNFHQAPILALTVFSIQKSAVQGQSPAAVSPFLIHLLPSSSSHKSSPHSTQFVSTLNLESGLLDK